MASGSQISGRVGKQNGSNLDYKEELERVIAYRQEVMRKNKDLEAMLLYTTQELEKEKENSRKIVQTLTERLMESRELINKLEIENMRYKKDCMLAVQLLQCNKSFDQSSVFSAVKKLSEYTHPEGSDNDKNNEIKSLRLPRPRTLSKKKSNDKDTTALLAKQEVSDKIPKVAYHKNLTGLLSDQKPEKAFLGLGDFGDIPPKIDSHQQWNNLQEKFKESEGQNKKDTDNKGRYMKLDDQRFTEESKSALVASKKSRSTDDEIHINSIEAERVKKGNKSPESKPESLTDERQENNPLIVNETELSTKPSLKTAQKNEHMKLTEKNAMNSFFPKSKNTMQKDGDVGRSLISEKPVQGNVMDNAKTCRENSPQEISSAISSTVSDIIPEVSGIQTEDDKDGEIKFTINNNEKPLADHSMLTDCKTMSNDITSNEEGTKTTIAEAEDETTTAEENTPLV